jgi:hypothetical protein
MAKMEVATIRNLTIKDICLSTGKVLFYILKPLWAKSGGDTDDCYRACEQDERPALAGRSQPSISSGSRFGGFSGALTRHSALAAKE